MAPKTKMSGFGIRRVPVADVSAELVTVATEIFIIAARSNELFECVVRVEWQHLVTLPRIIIIE